MNHFLFFFFVFFYLLSQRRRWNAVSFYRPTIVKLFMGHLKTLIVASVISHSLDTVGERTPPPPPPEYRRSGLIGCSHPVIITLTGPLNLYSGSRTSGSHVSVSRTLGQE